MKTYFLFLFYCLPVVVFGQSERNLLTQTITPEQLLLQLSTEELYSQFPPYSDRARWDALPAYSKRALIEAGEKALSYSWKPLTAGTYLEFTKSGNRKVMEDPWNANHETLRTLIFAELAEGKERFLPAIIDGVWFMCEWSTWSISASIGLQKAGAGLPDVTEPVIELGTGIISNTLAWTYYLFKDSFPKYSKQLMPRIKMEIERRMLTPYYTRTDFWWMALDGKQRMVNNWNVWLNYNALTCLLLVEDDINKRTAGVYKTMRSVDQFINYYKDDGACEEGPAYWSHAGGMLYNYLSMLKAATNGSIDLFNNNLIKNIGTYITKAYIDGTYFLNYADASAKLKADAGLIYLYGTAITDTTLQQFGSYLATQQEWKLAVPVTTTIYGGIRNLFMAEKVLASASAPPYLEYAWLPQTGIAVARDEAGTSKGFYFSALGGHNDESHNHNDVGTTVLYYDAQPVLIDVGNETYTAKTFSKDRYAIWTMRSAYHNVPLVNGMEQAFGASFAAKNTRFLNQGKRVQFSLNLENAYPADAGALNWIRTYRLQRKKQFEIEDRFTLTFNNDSTALHFMTSAKVEKQGNGTLLLHLPKDVLEFHFDETLWSAELEDIAITDPLLLQSWPSVIHRIKLKIKSRKTSAVSKIIIKKSSS